MRCRYIDIYGYCRHREHKQKGDTPMKCNFKGCPYYEEAKIE